jgi:type I restriction-modification system DNA methylase subunit
LSDYDFASNISVNILSHILEHSISDMEELTAQVENINYDKKQSKKSFYTPAYIIKYIVDNTLDKLCKGKNIELNIFDLKIKQMLKLKNLQIKNKRKFNYLLNIKILDPACGSGAFLKGITA